MSLGHSQQGIDFGHLFIIFISLLVSNITRKLLSCRCETFNGSGLMSLNSPGGSTLHGDVGRDLLSCHHLMLHNFNKSEVSFETCGAPNSVHVMEMYLMS